MKEFFTSWDFGIGFITKESIYLNDIEICSPIIKCHETIMGLKEYAKYYNVPIPTCDKIFPYIRCDNIAAINVTNKNKTSLIVTAKRLNCDINNLKVILYIQRHTYLKHFKHDLLYKRKYPFESTHSLEIKITEIPN